MFVAQRSRAPLRIRRRQRTAYENGADSDARPNDPSRKSHGRPPVLLVGVGTAGDYDYVPVSESHCLEKSQRAAVLRGDELHLNFVPGVEGIRADFTDTLLRERGGGAERQYPLG